MKKSSFIWVLAALIFVPESFSLNDNLARTPPMGWNPYNTRSESSQRFSLAVAQALISSGMRDAGYTIVSVDGNWQEIDAQGRLAPPNFPNGMKWMCDTLHKMGLKFGAYSNCHVSRGREALHAGQMAEWGVDHLKYDFCDDLGGSGFLSGYTGMGYALRNSGRPIIFNLCIWGATSVWQWGDTVGHSWRMHGDIGNGWSDGTRQYEHPIMEIVDADEPLWPYAGPTKGWNDPDVLEVGNAPLTNTEGKSHFSLWCMLAAPLFAGNDVTTMSDSTRMILTNREVIALDQDSLGHQGRRVIRTQDSLDVWVKKLKNESNPDWGVLFLNRSSKPRDISVTWQDIAKADPQGKSISSTKSFNGRDLWDKKNLGLLSGSYTARAVAPHGVVVLRLFADQVSAIGHNGLANPTPKVAVWARPGWVTLKLDASEPSHITIVDVRGVIVYSKSYRGSGYVKIATKDMPGGLYYIHFQNGAGSFSKKLLVE